jgi:hypothetical protein
VIAYLARKQFNFIDGLGFVSVGIAVNNEQWIVAAVLSVVMPILSILAQRALPEPPEVKP